MSQDFYQEVTKLRELGRPFAVATVIAVRGSASAKPGSKAIIDEDGKNVWGWVGGGCAETFVAKNAVEAMGEGQTRIIQADLDDEVFGLGMPCGGVMDIFIDPQHPPLELSIETRSDSERALKHLAETLNFQPKIKKINKTFHWPSIEQAIYDLSQAIASQRGCDFDHMRNSRGLPLGDDRPKIEAKIPELLIVGSSRITEELAKFAAILEWPVRVYGWNVTAGNYPETTKIDVSEAAFLNFKATAGSVVIIASHHKGDPEFISRSLKDGAAYVGLIASEKRSRLVFESLSGEAHAAESIFAPAGLNMNCRNPSEIALSCLAEILTFKKSSL
jgi:xanthine/CO dehydrogenase XdhC/CoxF family maturation factor